MSSPLAALLLTLALRADPEIPLQPEECRQPATRIRLSPEQQTAEHVVCVTPGVVTTVTLDTPMGSGAVHAQEEGSEAWLDVGRRTLIFSPGEDMTPGTRRKVEVRFLDRALPTSVSFVLVGTTWGAARQVEVTRQPLAVEACLREEQRQREALLRCEQEKQHMRVGSLRPAGLIGAVIDGTLTEAGLRVRDISKLMVDPKGAWYDVFKVISYLGPVPAQEGQPMRWRVVLEMVVLHNGEGSWVGTWGLLQGPKGTEPIQAQVWQSEPLSRGQRVRVVVGAELSEDELRSPWRLLVWDEQRERLLSLGNLLLR